MTMRQKKLKMSEECTLLTYSDIQECIDLVNEECDNDFEGRQEDILIVSII